MSEAWTKDNCKDCGADIIVSIYTTEMYADYWHYCSNKLCKNHAGQQIGDMEEPTFAKNNAC